MLHFKKPKNSLDIDKETFNKVKDDALIIDVRDPGEFELLKKIPSSINIPYLELIKNPSKYIPNKTQYIVTICNAGHRSTAAAESLQEQGYENAHVLSMGIYGYYRK